MCMLSCAWQHIIATRTLLLHLVNRTVLLHVSWPQVACNLESKGVFYGQHQHPKTGGVHDQFHGTV